ncbi:hypothetical protein HWD99_09355 [Microbacterium sp. C5A9]|uniref:hypothetical protein n=1 Tax=Microbacterium sp. C5A9 TaxID=2736663 RepID=UPI001F52A88B|nr:hypothetical protein [Microbacterium sp. C5A9]MCI1018830.1 hypothetical protein [Microbacterium sp. C5A9]
MCVSAEIVAIVIGAVGIIVIVSACMIAGISWGVHRSHADRAGVSAGRAPQRR